MTRELKLALIVGFSLVLTVAILVSDHLSKARTANIATLSDTQKVAAKVPESPIRSLEELLPSQLPAAMEVSAPVASTGDAASGPATLEQPVGADNSLAEHAPVVIGQQQVGSSRESKIGGGNVSMLSQTDGAGPLSASIREHAGTPNTQAAPAGATPQEIVEREVKKAESPKTAPLAGEKTHKVAEGDSLYAICKKTYGDGTLWKKVAAANPGKATENGGLKVGSVLVLPSKESLTGKTETKIAAKPTRAEPKPEQKPEPKALRTEPAKSEANKHRSYQVRPGDTLTNIARKQLGSANRGGEIASLNKMDPDDDLLAGAILKLPAQ